ncbi:MAG: hypothetical protein SPI83_08405 [Rothia sp. (in: high G+C Gram-positive bacteria)]|nr:hypothetical protein [Rothia sp. (in: high G+C Gram-positive bacteria)]
MTTHKTETTYIAASKGTSPVGRWARSVVLALIGGGVGYAVVTLFF